ncbi:MAG: cytochrome c biogenesis protein CcsA [Gammaproteobacteria bacterium]|nr:cytochrome c biogenesis protein CcsA [Gammaproteobacteria bacterium]
MTELPWLYAGIAAYAFAAIAALVGVARLGTTMATVGGVSSVSESQRNNERLVLLLMTTSVILLTITLADRWLRIGHGPFVNLFELLISQLFSLGLVYTIAYWRIPVLRTTSVVVLPLMGVLAVWVMVLEPSDSVFPPTYHNPWLWAHVGFGKFFLAFCLIGTGLAGVILLRSYGFFKNLFRHLPDNVILDKLAWRFMLLALVFDSLMLCAGAVWAQDAWGRYWAWDALETSSFLNWLLLGASIHARTTYNVPIRLGAVLIISVLVFAFVTYFGTPFYSEAAHKGVI